MISKSRKAAIRAAANNARKAGSRAIYDLGENVENPLAILEDHKKEAMTVCEDQEEVEYFELCYLYKSEKGAKEFSLWNEGFWSVVGANETTNFA